MDHRAHIVSREGRAVAIGRPPLSIDALILNTIISVTVLLLGNAAWLHAT